MNSASTVTVRNSPEARRKRAPGGKQDPAMDLEVSER